MIHAWDEVQRMPERIRELVTERAALIEYGANVPRAEAERQALEQWNIGRR